MSSSAVVINSQDSRVENQTVAFYEDSGAVFTGLNVSGPPGQYVHIQFRPQTPEWEARTIAVALAPCAAGEVYYEDADQCTTCGLGSVKLTNSTQACSSCSEVLGISCPGGSEFYLEDGYWMPVEWIRANCPAESPDCFIDKVYQCPSPHDKGCVAPRDDPRINEAAKPYIPEAALCRGGHRADVVYCAACDRGYHMHMLRGCLECPESEGALGLTLGLPVLAMLLLLLLLFVGIRWSWYQSLPLLHRNLTTCSAPENHKGGVGAAPQLLSLSLMNVFVGHLQVTFQTTLIYRSAVIPRYYGTTLNSANMVSFSMISMLPIACIADHFDLPAGVGNFYWTFTFYAALPFVFAIPILIAVGMKWWNPFHTRGRPLLDEIDVGRSLTNEMHGDEFGDVIVDSDGKERARGGSFAEWNSDEQVWHGSPLYELSMPPGCAQKAGGREGDERFFTVNPLTLHALTSIPAGAGEHKADEREDQGGACGSTAQSQGEGEAGGEGDLDCGIAPTTLERQATFLQVHRPSVIFPGEEEDVEDIKAYGWRTIIIYMANTMLVYLHPTCATNMLHLFNCENVYLDADQWWVRADYSVECFTPRWFTFSIVAIAVLVVYFLGLPCALALVPRHLTKYKRVRYMSTGILAYVHEAQLTVLHDYHLKMLEEDPTLGGTLNASAAGHLHSVRMTKSGQLGVVVAATSEVVEVLYDTGSPQSRMQTALMDMRARSIFHSYMEPFREELYAWYAYDMVRKLLQTSAVIVVQLISPDYDLFYAMFFSLFALAIHACASPYKDVSVNRWQTSVLAFHAFTILVYIGEKYTTNETASFAVDLALVGLQSALLVSLGCTICFYAVQENERELVTFATKIKELPYIQKIIPARWLTPK
ncbi:hypothetical protein CYMTET_50340 [Cymbomonas tetramitiformis]|uniref:Uncharacterized protein n=1 Tax=Cymbomonas tetramitiformis TaxID=36881 RepID=A0AAE0BQA2_9CHLO|nr:hypothetical protein CYMTET_50340 [Cymbomonas tetramitiformis]